MECIDAPVANPEHVGIDEGVTAVEPGKRSTIVDEISAVQRDVGPEQADSAEQCPMIADRHIAAEATAGLLDVNLINSGRGQ